MGSADALHVQGDFVELGTGRGFTKVGVLTAFGTWPQGDRQLWLLGTYEPGRIDAAGEHASAASPHYAVSYEATPAALPLGWGEPRQGAPSRIAGRLLDHIKKIAILHIDLNHRAAEVASLRMLWQRISPGVPAG